MRTTQPYLLIVILALVGHNSFGQETASAATNSNFKLKQKLGNNYQSTLPTTQDTLHSRILINGKLYEAIVVDGDTIPLINLPQTQVKAERVFSSKKQKRRYRRLEKNIRKVYPFAKLANEKLKAYEHTMEKMSASKRKKFLRKAEKDIRKEFEGELKAMTFTQGRILLKLIDRETGEVSYELVKTLRGGFTAWIFQGVAKIFKFDLKSEYDASEDDRYIEEIVRKIEQEEALSQSACK